MKERKDKKMQHILESLFLDTALPFRVRLFNILAIVGVLISVMNGIFSYVNSGNPVLLFTNGVTAVLSFSLLYYAYKSRNYQFCYFITIIAIFMILFPILFFQRRRLQKWHAMFLCLWNFIYCIYAGAFADDLLCID